MTRRHLVVAVAAIVLAGCGTNSESPGAQQATTPTASGTATTVAEPSTEQLRIAAPSLDGNLLGDPSEVDVAVQTPASYSLQGHRRYPAVYFLGGYDEGPTFSLGIELEKLVAAGVAPEMIVVAVSGMNALGGSFYVDSPVSGNWGSAVVDDVVTAIDASYRTLATPASRGIAGVSMGGYGALALAMTHPDVFGAVYALSPGLFAPGGLAESQMFADPSVVEDFLTGQAELAAMPPEEAAMELVRTMGRSGDVRFSAAYGAAFAPDPTLAPPWIRYPITDPLGQADPDAWATWERGFGGLAMSVDDMRDQLLALRGIVIDVGMGDEYRWIPPGSEYLHEQLDEAGIPNRLERFDGGHGPVGPRAGEIMFPFFADVLAAG